MSKKKAKENQESPFTRTPWEPAFRDRGSGFGPPFQHGDYVVLGSDGTIIAEVVTGMGVDACLLASAPALLAACEKLVSAGDDWQCELEDDAPHVQEMREALDVGIAAINLAKPPPSTRITNSAGEGIGLQITNDPTPIKNPFVSD